MLTRETGMGYAHAIAAAEKRSVLLLTLICQEINPNSEGNDNFERIVSCKHRHIQAPTVYGKN